MTASEIAEFPGNVRLYGQDAMREPHWEWRGTDKMLPQVAWLIKTPEGESAAILRIFLRMLRSETRTFRAVGIGGIWTYPNLRQQGYASELLLQTMAKLRVDQPSADVVVMYSKPRALYQTQGFSEIVSGLLAVPLHGDVTIREAEWRVEPEGHF